MVSFGELHLPLFCSLFGWSLSVLWTLADQRLRSAATNNQTGEGVAIKKVTNVFSKKILAKRALREIKLLQHFRGHRNVCITSSITSTTMGMPI